MKTFSTLLLFLFFANNITAQYVYGDDNFQDEAITSIQPPIEMLQPTFSNFIVMAKKATTLTAGKDTKIFVPPYAFVDRNGNVIKGNVDIQYREFKNPLDIFLSGIPMTVEENGKEEFFQSAGMVEFRAYQNGAEIFPNPDREPVVIEITSTQTDEDFNLYTLDENSGEWNEEGKDQIVFNSQSDTPIDASLFQNFFLDANMPPPPILEIARPSIVKLNRRSHKWLKKKRHHLQFTIKGISSFKNKRGRNFHGKFLSELKSKNPPIWIYDGPNKKTTSKLLSKLVRANKTWKKDVDSLEQYIVKDIQLIPNLKGDNYTIKFHCKKNKTWSIEAYPHLANNSIVEQKRNKAFYKKYKTAYNKRCEEWKKTDQEYQADLTKFEQDLIKFQKDLLLTNLNDTTKVSRRRIGVVTFGVLNIDKIMKNLNEERPFVFNLKNQDVEVRNIFVLDKTNNAMLTYNLEQKIRFDRTAKNSLIIGLSDDSFAIISASEFKTVFANSTENQMTFTINDIQSELLTRKILSDALAIN